MKILVVGGSGFVGANMLEFLLSKKKIEIYSTYFKKKPIIKNKRIKYFKTDLRILTNCLKISKSVDHIFMFAGFTFSNYVLKNKDVNKKISDYILINLNMHKAAMLNKSKSYFWLSSTTGYSSYVANKKFEEKNFFDYEPHSNYFVPGYLARFLERMIKNFSKLYDTKIFTLRPSEIFGEYDDFNSLTSHALPAYIKKFLDAKNNVDISVSGNYKFKKNYIYVKELVKICYMLLSKKKKYLELNISSQEKFSLEELLSILKEIFKDKNINLVFDRNNISGSRTFSNRKLEKLIKYKVNYSMKAAVIRTVEWLKYAK